PLGAGDQRARGVDRPALTGLSELPLLRCRDSGVEFLVHRHNAELDIEGACELSVPAIRTVRDGGRVDDGYDLAAGLAELAFREQQLRHVAGELPLLPRLRPAHVREDLNEDRWGPWREGVQLQPLEGGRGFREHLPEVPRQGEADADLSLPLLLARRRMKVARHLPKIPRRSGPAQ